MDGDFDITQVIRETSEFQQGGNRRGIAYRNSSAFRFLTLNRVPADGTLFVYIVAGSPKLDMTDCLW
jgi:hypothetical protein